jgi:alanyl-tRNA synthetase
MDCEIDCMTDRLYYGDSFLRSFEARVVDIRESSRTDGVSIWQIALDRSAFYPTSGGQPCDSGTLKAVSRTGAVLEVPIEGVEEDESGEVWHFTRKPLLAGTLVTGEIDWDRRLDHIQQHSGQHLLSAVFVRELEAPTVSFHLGEEISTIDLASGAIAHHSLERVERIANQITAEARSVAVRTVEGGEAKVLLAAGKLRKLPEREGPIRLIEIADYDLNACGGTHVHSTGQIGGLMIRSVEKISRGMRVSYVCGLRAVRAARRDAALLEEAGRALSTGPEGVPAAVERLVAEGKSLAKTRMKLHEELANYHAARLVVEELIHRHLRLVRRVFPDRDRDYVKLLASRVVASAPHTVALLVSTEEAPARVVLARSQDMDLHCGEVLKSALAELGLRGGGSPDLAQGDLSPDQVEAFIVELERKLRELFAQ